MIDILEYIKQSNLEKWEIDFFKQEIKELNKLSKQDLIYHLIAVMDELKGKYEDDAGESL